jgi:hypothetical protein
MFHAKALTDVSMKQQASNAAQAAVYSALVAMEYEPGLIFHIHNARNAYYNAEIAANKNPKYKGSYPVPEAKARIKWHVENGYGVESEHYNQVFCQAVNSLTKRQFTMFLKKIWNSQ